jgi:hypothetical protein
MNEAEWLTETDPDYMLRGLADLGRSPDGQLSNRKLWLYMAGCVRRIWHLLWGDRLREAVATTELFADRLASDGAFLQAASRAHDLAVEEESSGSLGGPPYSSRWSRASAAAAVSFMATEIPRRWEAETSGGWAVAAAADRHWLNSPDGERRWKQVKAQEEDSQAGLLRDIFGNPFRPVALDSALRTPAVLALTQAAYDNRNLPVGTLEPDRLAILADALEEAGCTDADLLGHLRSQGAHVRGCWAVDLLLTKG